MEYFIYGYRQTSGKTVINRLPATVQKKYIQARVAKPRFLKPGLAGKNIPIPPGNRTGLFLHIPNLKACKQAEVGNIPFQASIFVPNTTFAAQ